MKTYATYLFCFAAGLSFIVALFNFNDFRAYSNLKQIADQWAMQFVEAMKRKPGDPKVKDSKVFVPVNF